MFLRCSKRRQDGKRDLSWSVVENRRLPDRRVVRRPDLYLGDLNGVQESSWRKTVELTFELPEHGSPKIQAWQPALQPVSK